MYKFDWYQDNTDSLAIQAYFITPAQKVANMGGQSLLINAGGLVHKNVHDVEQKLTIPHI